MTTLVESWPEPNAEAIAQRLRMYMGDKKISRKRLALASGIGRSTLSTKLDGQGEFSLNELLAIGRGLGKHWMWVMTGDESFPDAPPDPPTGQPSPPPTEPEGELSTPTNRDPSQPTGRETHSRKAA